MLRLSRMDVFSRISLNSPSLLMGSRTKSATLLLSLGGIDVSSTRSHVSGGVRFRVPDIFIIYDREKFQPNQNPYKRSIICPPIYHEPMGKKKPAAKKPNLQSFKPLVSVCTPTFNRRPFIPIMFECFRNQTYPKDRIEWIIVDDGTDKIRDLVESSGIHNIKYFALDQKMPLGQKRNYMHKQAKGSIIVYMDDDDYYPPERVEHAVEKLMANKEALCAGSSEMYIYFKHIGQMVQCGPYGPNHATAGTFAFKSRLLDDTQYEDHAALAEEKAFLKNYTIPFVQLDPLKTILVFSHIHNTFDKKKLLENPHPDFFKNSDKPIEAFIKGAEEAHIKQFFLHDIDSLLSKYEPGEPKMKPDVLEQTKKIEIEREKMKQQMQQQQQQQKGASIIMQQPGKEPVELNPQQVLTLIQSQQQDLQRLTGRIRELEEMNAELQKRLLIPASQSMKEKLKSEPEIEISV
jgi:Glycosyl transferase family 2